MAARPARGAASSTVSLGRRDYGAPAGAPYTAEEVVVRTSAGHSLTGTLTIPRDTRGPVPAIVTITGSGQEDRDEYIPLVPNYRPFRQLADTLCPGDGVLAFTSSVMGSVALNPGGHELYRASKAALNSVLIDTALELRSVDLFLSQQAQCGVVRSLVPAKAKGPGATPGAPY